jgi:hypothetical protein
MSTHLISYTLLNQDEPRTWYNGQRTELCEPTQAKQEKYCIVYFYF